MLQPRCLTFPKHQYTTAADASGIKCLYSVPELGLSNTQEPKKTCPRYSEAKLSAPVSLNISNDFFFKHIGFRKVPNEADYGIFCFYSYSCRYL